MRVTWLGHATTAVELDGVRLLTDPVLTGRLGPLHNVVRRDVRAAVAPPDAVLISHVHHDHLHLPSLRRLPAGTRLVLPRGAARYLGKARRWEVEELDVGGTTRVGTVTVQATYADHIAVRNRRGLAVVALGYLVTGSQRVYFAGDTDMYHEMSELAPHLDVALLPVGGWGLNLGPGHMDPAAAADALGLLRPRAAVPIHWGTLRLPMAWRMRPELFTEPGPEFRRQAAARAPDVDVHIAEPGRALDLS
jgi:L-ascorbate metabolism protein UlaG (beta-lactamase superfamily)